MVNHICEPISPNQLASCRSARALQGGGEAPLTLMMGVPAEDLARESTLGVTTIRRAELAEGETSMTTANDAAVRRTLEAAGVEFIDGNGGGPGVRLRKAHQHGKRK